MADQNTHTHRLFYHSPVGWLRLEATDSALTTVWFSDEKDGEDDPNPLTLEAQDQLQAYFDQKRTQFDLPLAMAGTDFQKNVWEALGDIPFGTTISYLELSRRLGDVKAIRAVGHANGQNPLSIIVPCHRVIGKDGSLVGYGGGLERKKWLLRHEGLLLQGELPF